MRKRLFLVLFVLFVFPIETISVIPNYAEILHKSYLFYHGQKSGILNGKRRLAWRGDSCFECKGPNGEDLSGGFYEAGA
jgi:hypothetical protein